MRKLSLAALMVFAVLVVGATTARIGLYLVDAFTAMATTFDGWDRLKSDAWWALLWTPVLGLVAWVSRRWGGDRSFGQWPLLWVALLAAAASGWRLRIDIHEVAALPWMVAETALVVLGYVVLERVPAAK